MIDYSKDSDESLSLMYRVSQRYAPTKPDWAEMQEAVLAEIGRRTLDKAEQAFAKGYDAVIFEV